MTTKKSCEECGRPAEVQFCQHCATPLCESCIDDHVETHGDIEPLDEGPIRRKTGLVEGTRRQLGL